jgi:hypothetical protein
LNIISIGSFFIARVGSVPGIAEGAGARGRKGGKRRNGKQA